MQVIARFFTKNEEIYFLFLYFMDFLLRDN